MQDATPPRSPPRGDTPATLDECRRCDLWRNATHGVPGSGPRSARIMLIGDRHWQIRLTGETWRKSIHPDDAQFEPAVL